MSAELVSAVVVVIRGTQRRVHAEPLGSQRADTAGVLAVMCMFVLGGGTCVDAPSSHAVVPLSLRADIGAQHVHFAGV
jgi:hypothetical protein